MIIKKIVLEQFRNIEREELEFSKDFNIFLGKNGEGKTNILEAVFFSGTLRSFRTKTFSDMKFNFSNEKMNIFSKYEYNSFKRDILLNIIGRKKELFIDDVKEDPATLTGLNSFITFIPDDLKIVKKDPVYRRKFLNELCCLIFPEYYNNLIKYKKVVHNRNILLKEGKKFVIWDEMYCDLANYILRKRHFVVEKLKESLPQIYAVLTSKNEKISIEYNGDIKISLEKLKEFYEKDRRTGYSNLGPHKDDLRIRLDDFDVRKSASQGQLRTVIFGLKMAQAEIVKILKKENPVLILDDIFSELDNSRKEFFLNYINGKYQVFLSSNTIDEKINEKIKNKKIFFIREGKIEKEEFHQT